MTAVVLTKEEIECVLATLDLCLEEGRCRTTPERIWEEIAKHVDGRTGEELQRFFMEWEGGDVDVSYVVSFSRAGRSGGDLVNLKLDTAVYMELDFQPEHDAGPGFVGEEEDDSMTRASRLCFPVSILKNMLKVSNLQDEKLEDDEDDEEDDEEEEGEEEERADVDPSSAESGEAQAQSSATDQEEAMDSTGSGEIEVSAEAAVYTAAVMEYIAAELMELAGTEARSNRHGCIQTSDIQRAIKQDELLLELFPDAAASDATLPRVLTDSAAPLRVDLYWRAEDRYPGGNLDTFTVRYRFDLQPDSYQVTLDYHRNWDGVHHVGGGLLPELAGVEENMCVRVRDALAAVVRSNSVTQGLSRWTLVDETTRDSNSYDTDWSSIELLASDPTAPEKPFLCLRQSRVLGLQYRPAPSYTPKLVAASPEQEAAMQLLSAAVGMGRPQEYSEGVSPAARHQSAVPSVQLPSGLPAVQPEYFRY